jgi:hypothetical protein
LVPVQPAGPGSAVGCRIHLRPRLVGDGLRRVRDQQPSPEDPRLEDPRRSLRGTATLAPTARCCNDRLNSRNIRRLRSPNGLPPPGSALRSGPSAMLTTTRWPSLSSGCSRRADQAARAVAHRRAGRDRHPRVRRLVQPSAALRRMRGYPACRTRNRLLQSPQRPRRGQPVSKMSPRTRRSDSVPPYAVIMRYPDADALSRVVRQRLCRFSGSGWACDAS